MAKYITIPLTSVQVGWFDGPFIFPWHWTGAWFWWGRNEEGGTAGLLCKLHIKWP